MEKHLARRVEYKTLLEGLTTEVDAGNVSVGRDGPLALFKYTPQCTFEKAWSPWSLIARGLILDTEREVVVATPFQKFANYAEGLSPNADRKYPTRSFVTSAVASQPNGTSRTVLSFPSGP